MLASIKDREAWIMEKEEEFAVKLYKLSYSVLPSSLQAVVYRWASQDYDDTLSDYAESRGKNERAETK